MENSILHGNSVEVLKGFPDNYFHSVVTDAPYGISFMSKHWDYDVPTIELWKEVLRVLKPGGFLLSFGGTRTYHRMVVNIEDAGFEIRDQIMWIYGSGFPKSTNVALRIDKESGAIKTRGGVKMKMGHGDSGTTKPSTGSEPFETYESKSDEAKQWQGWGTALKPANEPIVVARKPLSESTVAKNVLKHGTGGLNIDGSRIEGIADCPGTTPQTANGNGQTLGNMIRSDFTPNTQGRWPANIIFDEIAAQMLGEPSRFFYVAKASKRERNAGLEGMPEKVNDISGNALGVGSKLRMANAEERAQGLSKVQKKSQQNHHPTVKPTKLMEYLIKLVTPPAGIVLDPFCGSGSTGVAAKNLGFGFVGIEMDAAYVEIAKRRIG